jgi:hypothetical protein
VDVVTVNNETDSNESQGKGQYTYVKGGRFSKSNVKKRNNTSHKQPGESNIQSEEPQQNNEKGDKGLIIAICVLLVAIVAVVIYIVMHFFVPGQQSNADIQNTMGNNTTLNAQDPNKDYVDPTEEETIVLLPCEDIILPNTVIEFDKIGAAYLLNYFTEPDLTCDAVYFTSSDETVATIDQIGKITAVGAGQAIIKVRCGEIEKECRVVCNIDEQSTQPSDETTAPTVSEPDTNAGEIVLKLNYTFTYPLDPSIGDVSLAVGKTWIAYIDAHNQISSKDVTFTSSDPSVATISDRGVVTAVGAGETIITAEYQGQQVKCRVICN